jgi:hypothetical protein
MDGVISYWEKRHSANSTVGSVLGFIVPRHTQEGIPHRLVVETNPSQAHNTIGVYSQHHKSPQIPHDNAGSDRTAAEPAFVVPLSGCGAHFFQYHSPRMAVRYSSALGSPLLISSRACDLLLGFHGLGRPLLLHRRTIADRRRALSKFVAQPRKLRA